MEVTDETWDSGMKTMFNSYFRCKFDHTEEYLIGQELHIVTKALPEVIAIWVSEE